MYKVMCNKWNKTHTESHRVRQWNWNFKLSVSVTHCNDCWRHIHCHWDLIDSLTHWQWAECQWHSSSTPSHCDSHCDCVSVSVGDCHWHSQDSQRHSHSVTISDSETYTYSLSVTVTDTVIGSVSDCVCVSDSVRDSVWLWQSEWLVWVWHSDCVCDSVTLAVSVSHPVPLWSVTVSVINTGATGKFNRYPDKPDLCKRNFKVLKFYVKRRVWCYEHI